MLIMGLVDAIIICVLGVLETDKNRETIQNLFDAQRYAFFTIRDFLTILTILVIYYYQGIVDR